MTHQPVRYRFGEFELDTESYALTHSGQELRLRPKVFNVLRYLLEHHGRLVSKQELLDALWSGSHVDEVAIPWTISHARRALGQRSGDKQPIETVHGRGYRFTASVDVVERAAAETISADAHEPEEQPPALPFVGRDDAMAQLQARLREAKAGRGGLSLLLGEAGIGKTRCMDELAVLARADGFTVWAGRSVEATWSPVFWPWVQIVRSAVLDRPALRDAGNALLSRLGVLDGSPSDSTDPQNEDPSGSFWLFDGVSRLLVDAGRQAPTLLLLDDLHEADAGTIDLLAFVAPELRHLPVLAVATQRDGRAAYRTRQLRRLSRHAERVELGPLTPNDVGHYISLITHGSTPGPELCLAVHRATAGNALFLRQTVRTLIAQYGQGALGSLSPALVSPAKLARDVLRSGIDTLDEHTGRVLSVASVLGESFDVSTLQDLCGLDLEGLLAALEAASRDGLVVAEGPNGFRFCHALLRSILYDDLSTTDRVVHHRRAAEVLEKAAQAKPRHSEIAHHYYRSLAAGDCSRVTVAAKRAAQAAAGVQAFADAAIFCRWALEAQALDPHGEPRARAELLLLCAQMERRAGHGEDAHRTISQLIEIARHHAYGDLLVRAARVLRPAHVMGPVADPQLCAALEQALMTAPEGPNELRISALSQLSWVPPYALDMRRSKELSACALALARELNNEAALFKALHAQLYALSGPDDIDAVLAVADEMLARDRVPSTWVSVEALAARYAALLYRGDLANADATLAALGHIGRERQWPEVIWAHDRLVAQRSFHAGHFAVAEGAFTELRVRGQRLRLSYGGVLTDIMHAVLVIERDGPRAFASCSNPSALLSKIHDVMVSVRPSIARLAAELGQPEPARAVLDVMAADAFEKIPKEIGYLNALANLALVAIHLRDRSRAERLYELLAPYPHHNTPNCMRFYEGSVSHFLAVLAAFLNWNGRAKRHFDDALGMNDRLGQRPQLARTCYEYARWLLGRGRAASRKRGREMQARAIALAEATGMSWLAAQARSLD